MVAVWKSFQFHFEKREKIGGRYVKHVDFMSVNQSIQFSLLNKN